MGKYIQILFILTPEFTLFHRISKASASRFYILPNHSRFPISFLSVHVFDCFASFTAEFELELIVLLLLVECCSHCTLFCDDVVVAGTQKNQTLSKSAGSLFPDMFSPIVNVQLGFHGFNGSSMESLWKVLVCFC